MEVALSPDYGKIFQISHAETKATLSSNMSVGCPTMTKIAFFFQILMPFFSKSIFHPYICKGKPGMSFSRSKLYYLIAAVQN